MLFDLDNPVVRLCSAGMQVDGEPEKARALFEQAWNARRDDFDASIAAHFVARHQATAEATREWNERALRHAEAVTDERVATLFPSLYLNLAESYRVEGRVEEAEALVQRGLQSIKQLDADDGYLQFVQGGLERLLQRLRTP